MKFKSPFVPGVNGPSPSVVAELMKVPVGNVRRLYASNAEKLAEIAAEARLNPGKKLRGFTADEWQKYSDSALAKSRQ